MPFLENLFSKVPTGGQFQVAASISLSGAAPPNSITEPFSQPPE